MVAEFPFAGNAPFNLRAVPEKGNFRPQFRVKKALTERCIMIGPAYDLRAELGESYGQDPIDDRGCCNGRAPSVAAVCKSGERTNRRRRRRRTHRGSFAGQRTGAAARSAAGLLCARATLYRRTGLPGSSGALLGWIWLGVPKGPGLQLIARSWAASAQISPLLFDRAEPLLKHLESTITRVNLRRAKMLASGHDGLRPGAEAEDMQALSVAILLCAAQASAKRAQPAIAV